MSHLASTSYMANWPASGHSNVALNVVMMAWLLQ